MFKRIQITKSCLRFRRWSRARYAVFSSLSNVVNIGCISISIANKSLQKAVGLSSEMLFHVDYESKEPMESIETELTLVQLDQVILTNYTSDCVQASSQTHLIIHPSGLKRVKFSFNRFF